MTRTETVIDNREIDIEESRYRFLGFMPTGVAKTKEQAKTKKESRMPHLKEYTLSRTIPLEPANKYLKEVCYTVKGQK